MKKYFLILLAVLLVAGIVFFMLNYDDLQYNDSYCVCRKCGATKFYWKQWYSSPKIEINDTPESSEVKRLFPEHAEHDWLEISGSSKPWFKYGFAWDGRWHGEETLKTIVHASVSDEQKQEYLKKFYAIEDKPRLKTKDMKLFIKQEDIRAKKFKELQNEIDIFRKTFATPEEAAFEAFIFVPSGKNGNDCFYKNADKPATINYYRTSHRYCEIDMNNDGEKEYIFELNGYIDKTIGEFEIEGNSGGCKWAIIQKTPKGRYIIRHIEEYGGWPSIYESRTNGWYDIVFGAKGGRQDDGVRWDSICKLIWNGNNYIVAKERAIRTEEGYGDFEKFIKEVGLEGVKKIGPSRPQ